MSSTDLRYGFRVVGGVYETRRLITAAAAFVGHCAADPKAQPEREYYLSAFCFGDDLRTHLETLGTPKGFQGVSCSPWLWFDIDRSALDTALADVRRLVGYLLFRYHHFADDDLLFFFTGQKGFHVGVPLTHNPSPSATFHRACRKLAEGIAGEVGVVIDTSIYDRVRLFRAPNSRHPKTGLHKRRLTHDEMMGLSAERIQELAREPFGFELQTVSVIPPLLATDWQEAETIVRACRTATVVGNAEMPSRLNRDTLAFIREGADDGERHTRLFRAAANLREFGASQELVHALLAEAALDSGLPPAEVRRQIECGVAHADQQAKGGAA